MMPRSVTPKLSACIVAVVVAAIGLSACGSSSSSSNSTSSGSPSSSTATGSSSASSSPNATAAKALLAPYTGQPSSFPVSAPLGKRPAAGTTFAFLQCVTPVCAAQAAIFKKATAALGVKLVIESAGASAQDLQNAMNAIIAQKPAAVVIPGIQLSTIGTEISQLHKMNIPISVSGVMDASQYGISDQMVSRANALLSGRLLAAWTVEQKPGTANAVFYTTPELDFSAVVQQGFTTELKHSARPAQRGWSTFRSLRLVVLRLARWSAISRRIRVPTSRSSPPKRRRQASRPRSRQRGLATR